LFNKHPIFWTNTGEGYTHGGLRDFTTFSVMAVNEFSFDNDTSFRRVLQKYGKKKYGPICQRIYSINIHAIRGERSVALSFFCALTWYSFSADNYPSRGI